MYIIKTLQYGLTFEEFIGKINFVFTKVFFKDFSLLLFLFLFLSIPPYYDCFQL